MEVQRVRLIRFLSKVALADIFSIAWLSVFQTHDSKCVFIRVHRASSFDLVEMFQQFPQRFRLRVEKERILPTQNVHIRQNSSLRRQEECIAPRSR